LAAADPLDAWSTMAAWQIALVSWRLRASSARAASGRRRFGRSSCSSCPPATSTTTRAASVAPRWAGRPIPTAAIFTGWRQPPGSLSRLLPGARPA